MKNSLSQQFPPQDPRPLPNENNGESQPGQQDAGPLETPEKTLGHADPERLQNRNPSVVLVLKFADNGRQIDSQKQHGTVTFSEDEIREFSQIALDASEEYGTLAASSLRYYKETGTQGDIRIAFYDTTNMEQTMRGLLLSFITAGLACLVIFYGISVLLIRFCLRPMEKAWKQQQDFIADASHELKTPLTVILANLALLRQQEKDSPLAAQKPLDYIEEEAGHMSRLVNDMLFLARSDARRETLPAEQVNLSDIFYHCYLSFESVAYEKGIFPETDLEEGILVTGSEEKLGRLCGILLDNACKYADAHGRIALSLHKKITVRSSQS